MAMTGLCFIVEYEEPKVDAPKVEVAEGEGDKGDRAKVEEAILEEVGTRWGPGRVSISVFGTSSRRLPPRDRILDMSFIYCFQCTLLRFFYQFTI